MKVLYFAWLRDRIGLSEEEVSLPDTGSATVSDLIAHLKERGDGYAHAFEDLELIHVAVNMEEVPHQTSLAGATEVAFYPPFTGG